MAAYKYCMNTALFMYKYAGRIIPEAKRLLDKMSIMQKTATTSEKQSDDPADNARSNLDLRCYSLFALYPGLDTENALSFVAAFHTLTDYLDKLCRKNIPDSHPVM